MPLYFKRCSLGEKWAQDPQVFFQEFMDDIETTTKQNKSPCLRNLESHGLWETILMNTKISLQFFSPLEHASPWNQSQSCDLL